MSLLHVSVVCVLLGITLLVVGLVQLAPGAGEAPLPPLTLVHSTIKAQLWREGASFAHSHSPISAFVSAHTKQFSPNFRCPSLQQTYK